MYNNHNLTATQPDIYAILNTDDPEIEESIDTDALVKDILNTNYSSVNTSTIQPSTSNSSTSNEFNFNNDLINFDNITNPSSQYTPHNVVPPTYQESNFIHPTMDFSNRRHSVATATTSRFNPRPPPLFTHHLNPVSETHRASMPNIFLPQDQFNVRTTKAPPLQQQPVQFNSMPWSPANWVKPDLPIEPRKRFYSQQLDIQTCPLPMSGITSRRTSVASPTDIYTWNKMVSPNDRIIETRKRKAMQPLEEEPSTKKVKEEQVEDYPAITEADLEAAKKDPNAIPRRQKLRYEGDEYTPKWVRYTGQLKEGYCDTCKPGKWLQLKNSAYWYHKQFFHGISSVSGKPFEKPLEQRAGDHDVIEGLCHQCQMFVPICNSKRKNSVLWYRHAHKCHIYDKPKTKNNSKKDSLSVTPSPNSQLQTIY